MVSILLVSNYYFKLSNKAKRKIRKVVIVMLVWVPFPWNLYAVIFCVGMPQAGRGILLLVSFLVPLGKLNFSTLDEDEFFFF